MGIDPRGPATISTHTKIHSFTLGEESPKTPLSFAVCSLRSQSQKKQLLEKEEMGLLESTSFLSGEDRERYGC